MKMSEYFKLPLRCSIGFDGNADEFYTLMDSDNEIVLETFSRSEHDVDAIALAVNCHNDMLEALEELTAMVGRQPDFNDDGDGLAISRCYEAIAKAKGEEV